MSQKKEKGQSVLEFGLLLGLVAVLVIAVLVIVAHVGANSPSFGQAVENLRGNTLQLNNAGDETAKLLQTIVMSAASLAPKREDFPTEEAWKQAYVDWVLGEAARTGRDPEALRRWTHCFLNNRCDQWNGPSTDAQGGD